MLEKKHSFPKEGQVDFGRKVPGKGGKVDENRAGEAIQEWGLQPLHFEL